jgi:hypothetical protein
VDVGFLEILTSSILNYNDDFILFLNHPLFYYCRAWIMWNLQELMECVFWVKN